MNGRHGRGWKGNIKMDLEDAWYETGHDQTGSGKGNEE
jgi:hypothetical protein